MSYGWASKPKGLHSGVKLVVQYQYPAGKVANDRCFYESNMNFRTHIDLLASEIRTLTKHVIIRT